MLFRIAAVAFALAVAGCNQQGASSADNAAEGPQLDSPAPESEPSRVFAAVNDAARAAAAELTVSMTLRLPDQSGGDAQEVLTLRGRNGLVVESEISGAVSPATQVGGQTLRALLALPVEEPQVLVYRVTSETKPEGGGGLCGEGAPAYIVVWEPVGPGDAAMKVLGVSGGQPGAGDSRACPMLEYRRS